MNVHFVPGRYVVAVSGGVDSVVLLDMLSQEMDRQIEPQSASSWKVVIAHYDHGIRSDSRADRLLVQELAKSYGLPFVYDEGGLGPDVSEAAARQARYQFLEKAKRASRAQAIMTAHHQDDLLETAILNLIRGSGRKGIASLRSRPDLVRPLLGVPKRDLRAYAEEHQLAWHEDSTNQDESYKRNYVRLKLMPHFDTAARENLEAIILRQHQVNDELDTQLINLLHLQPSRTQLDRSWFNSLPHDIAKEVLAMWLRLNGLSGFDSRTLERLTIAAKVSRPGKRIDVFLGRYISVEKQYLALRGSER